MDKQADERRNLAVEMQGIVKSFGAFRANDGIDLRVRAGEIHAILGENGAGKTTLMNILYGLYPPTEGEIAINGQTVRIDGPNRAIALGIGMVHQHFMLVQPFTVTENIILGMEPVGRFRRVDMAAARARVQELSDRYGLAVNADARIEDISVGMQQRAEILKVLYRGADILIFDEPTASLTPQEIEELVGIMRRMTEQGKTIILITHKLREIMEVADHCTIIRQGRYIDTVRVDAVSEQELAAKMVGRAVEFRVQKQEREPDAAVLEVEGLRAADYRGIEVLRGLSLEVRRGEILGVAGIDGNGQTELVEVLTGLRKASGGSVRMLGEDAFNKTPRQLFDLGISSIPADRHKHGLVLDFPVADNLLLQNIGERPYSKHGTLNRAAILDKAKELVARFDIRPADCEQQPAGQLSGGNQQKVIIAREVTNDKDLLIAVNPTRGLDVGAIEYIHRTIVDQRNRGKAVLLVSFELDEILSLSDRIAVIYDGQIVGCVPAGEADEARIGLMMAGGEQGHA